MPKRDMALIESWVAHWPVGARGVFGGRDKEDVTVERVLWEYGLPTLQLKSDTGHTYYCKYGDRSYLKEAPL